MQLARAWLLSCDNPTAKNIENGKEHIVSN